MTRAEERCDRCGMSGLSCWCENNYQPPTQSEEVDCRLTAESGSAIVMGDHFYIEDPHENEPPSGAD